MGAEQNDTTRVIIDRPILAERFEVIKLLGEGAAGAVFLVKDQKNNGRLVALKILTNTEAFDENTLQRFLDELHISQSIQHPNIVSAYDFIKMNDSIAYTMEYVEGKDASTLLDEKLPSYEEIDNIMIQTLSALEELHRRGILHRDIKLENILVSKDGTTKLVDLGLMKRIGNQNKMTKTGILLGTAQYLPPEYIKKGEYLVESDLYATGLMMYELLAGERRLQNLDGAEAIDYLLETGFQVPRVSNLYRGQIPSKYEEILEKALNPKPKNRYSSAKEMAEAFKRVLLTSSKINENVISHAYGGNNQCSNLDSFVSISPYVSVGLGLTKKSQRTVEFKKLFFAVTSLFIGVALFSLASYFLGFKAIPDGIPNGSYHGEWLQVDGLRRSVDLEISSAGAFLALSEPNCNGGFVNVKTGEIGCLDKDYKLKITEVDSNSLEGILSTKNYDVSILFKSK
ncbi:MAG: serine/threonine-protein kinase [bacterium]|nr:serine/threonine-protein kinase [bacterium]